MKLTFHGGVEGVTGSCHPVEIASTRFLVDLTHACVTS